jgi:hypothetical protein
MRALVVATIALAGCGTGEQGIDGGELPFEDGAAASDGTSIDLDALVVSDGGAEAAPMGCMGLPDGTKCQSAPDACHTDGVCVMGQCSPPQVRPDGYNWKQGDEFARCCNGKPIITNTNSDCGVCGIQCNQNNGESCQLLGGRWFCRGCNTSAGCWSKCCSLSFNPPSCAASDCMGNCSSQYCPKGTTCKLGMGISSNYCAYP